MNTRSWVVGTLLLLPGIATAADVKTAPGNICSARLPATMSIESDIWGVLALTDNVEVQCPIVRDNSTGTMNSVAVRMSGDGAGEDIRCTVCSMAINSLAIGAFECLPFVTYSGSGYNSQAFNTTTIAEWDDGTYTVVCKMGQNDTIMSIKWNEP